MVMQECMAPNSSPASVGDLFTLLIIRNISLVLITIIAKHLEYHKQQQQQQQQRSSHMQSTSLRRLYLAKSRMRLNSDREGGKDWWETNMGAL